MKKYTVKDIEQPDFGCEGLLDGQVITDKVILEAENGDIISIDAADAYLYEKDINGGDRVYIVISAVIGMTKW